VRPLVIVVGPAAGDDLSGERHCEERERGNAEAVLEQEAAQPTAPAERIRTLGRRFHRGRRPGPLPLIPLGALARSIYLDPGLSTHASRHSLLRRMVRLCPAVHGKWCSHSAVP